MGYETIKAQNTLITQQNKELNAQLSEYLTQNTKIKQQIIEKNAQNEALQKEKNELSAQLSLSQQLNSPHIDSQNIVAPIFTKQHSQTNGNTEERLQRINSLISQSVENLDLEKIK